MRNEHRFSLGSKLLLSNALSMLNKNLTGFVQSLFSVQSIRTVRKGSASRVGKNHIWKHFSDSACSATGFGKSVCFFIIPYVCDYLYRSKIEGFSNPSFSSVVLVISPLKALMGDQLKEIVEYGLSGKKLHEGLTEDELVDVGEGKFKILISSLESLSEKENTGSATTITPIDEPHCVRQTLTTAFNCTCYVHFQLMKKSTISVLKLMESTCKLKIRNL